VRARQRGRGLIRDVEGGRGVSAVLVCVYELRVLFDVFCGLSEALAD
jgi:hypothetical protein